jgi:hypothetical protein
MIVRLFLLITALLISGCGGGGSSSYTQSAGHSVQRSWVQVLVADSGFRDSPEIERYVVLDPLGVDPNPANSHGSKVVRLIRTYTDAQIIGYLPWYQSCDYTGTCYSSMLDFHAAIQYAIDYGINVVNISWTGCCWSTIEAHSQWTADAFNHGVTVVWGAGNSGSQLPASNDPNLLVIGDVGDFANYGPAVDVCFSQGATSFDAAKASGLIAEMYEELIPTPDAAGATLIRDEFLRRYDVLSCRTL